MNEKIAIIDCDSMIYSAFMPNKVADELTGDPKKENGKFVYIDKTDKEIEESFDGIFHNLFVEGGFTHYIAFVKGKNTTNSRLSINSEYKQQRTKEIPPKWDFTKNYIIDKWGVIEINEIEVDDAVRITKLNTENSHIVAIDKDLLNLAGLNFNWRKNEWIEISKEQEEEYFSRSLIIGDTVDNIKGLKGKGEKFCDNKKIKKIGDAVEAYIEHYGFDCGLDEFFKNYKCLHILQSSEKFQKIPTPIKIYKTQEDETVIEGSRSTARKI